MNNELNQIIQDLADLSYIVLDLEEEIIAEQPSVSDCMKKISKIYQVLIFNQDKLIQLTEGNHDTA